MDEAGVIHKTLTKEYAARYPHPNRSEEDPEEWRAALLDGIPALLSGFDASLVKGIGAGGQRHGLVVLDREDHVIRPAILWNDGRTEREVICVNEEIGKEKLSALTANIAFAGFTAPKLFWMRQNERENFERIGKIMLPKEYINCILTGIHATDYSDASGISFCSAAEQSPPIGTRT